MSTKQSDYYTSTHLQLSMWAGLYKELGNSEMINTGQAPDRLGSRKFLSYLDLLFAAELGEGRALYIEGGAPLIL